VTLHSFITPTPTTTHRKDIVFYFYRPILRFVNPIRTLYHEFLRLERARLGVQKCPNVRSFSHSETFTLEKPSTRCALTPLTDAKQTWGAYSDDDATVETRERRPTRRDRFDAPARARRRSTMEATRARDRLDAVDAWTRVVGRDPRGIEGPLTPRARRTEPNDGA
jgi:hypothetical protein